jgi:hypothetical protein
MIETPVQQPETETYMAHPTFAGRRKLNRAEASAYLRDRHGLKCQPATLAKLATIGGGPVFCKQGARVVIYDCAELDRWAQTRLTKSVANTSQLAEGSSAAAGHSTEAQPGSGQ